MLGRRGDEKPVWNPTLPSRTIVGVMNGIEQTGPRLGDASSLLAVVGSIIPGATGQQAASTFTQASADFAAQAAAQAKSRQHAVVAGVAVTVVGLGVLTWFLLKR